MCIIDICDLFIIQGTLFRHGYLSILQRHTIPSGLRLVGLSFVFQQDNDPKCTSRLYKGYLTKESDGVLHQITWPPQSPDLNPIEMVWDQLDRRVKEKQPSAQNMWELLVGKAFLVKLFERMTRVSSRQRVATLKNLKYKIYFDLFNTFLVTTWFHSLEVFTIILQCRK